MGLSNKVKELLRKPSVKLAGLVAGGAMLFLPTLHAQEVNTTDSLLWKKQAVEQIVLNEHNSKPLPNVKTTYSLLDTLNAPQDLREQTFFTNDEGVFKDSVWTEIINPDYEPPVGIGDVFSDGLTEELKLFFDGSQFKFEGTTAIEPKTINIFSVTGQKVFSDKVDYYDPSTNHSEATFSLNNLSSGFYVLNVNNNPLYSLKFIKMQDGLLQQGTKKEIKKSSSQGMLKSFSDDEPITKLYERLFENTENFISFPSLKDTIPIHNQEEDFQTTTNIPDVNYLYNTSMKGTPGAIFDLSFQGADTTNFSLDVPADSVVVVPQVINKDDELVLKANEDKLGYDADSTSWMLPFGENSLLELYINKTKLPHSFSGQAHEGTELSFTLPDTTINTIADANNMFQTDTVWSSDSTFYDVLGYAVLDTYPSISDSFDADFGNHVRDYLVDTTMNGFNLLFKGIPSTDLEVVNTADDDVLFYGQIAQDSLARVPGYRSLEDFLNVTVSATLPWYNDSTFTMLEILPGTTSRDIYLERKTYDFNVELTTDSDVMVTGVFGGRDIDTLYSDAQGKLWLPKQQFFQPDSLQTVNLKLEKEGFYDESVSFEVKPDSSFYEKFLIGHRFANLSGVVEREDGEPITSMEVHLTNISNPDETYDLLPVDSTFTIDDIFLPKYGLSDSYKLDISIINALPYVGRFIDTLSFGEGDTLVNCVIPVVTQLMTYNVLVKDGNSSEPLQGVRVRAFGVGGDLWDSEVTLSDGTVTLEQIPLDTICRIEYGYKEENSSYFANWGQISTPSMILSDEEGMVDMPLVLYSKTRPVPGTYDEETLQSDSVIVTVDEIRDMFKHFNLELVKHQPVNVYIRMIDNEFVDTNRLYHRQTLETIDNVLNNGNVLFGTKDLVRRVDDMYWLTQDDIDRYTFQPNSLQDSIINWFDYGGLSNSVYVRIVTTPEEVTGALNNIVGSAMDENALTRFVFGNIMGMSEVFDRDDSYMSRLYSTIDQVNPATPKDRAIANTIFIDAWHKFYYKTSTFDITKLKDGMFSWFND